MHNRIRMQEFYYSLCRGQAVVTPEHAMVGIVTGIICDPATGIISVFKVAPGKHGVSPNDVVGWDPHHVVVKTEEAVGPLEEFVRAMQYGPKGNLIGKIVRTKSGVTLGKVMDFAIDPRSMRWSKLDVVKTGLIFIKKRYLIPRHQVLEIRTHDILVKDPEKPKRASIKSPFKKQALEAA